MKLGLLFIFTSSVLISCNYSDGSRTAENKADPAKTNTPPTSQTLPGSTGRLLTDSDLNRILAQSGNTLIQVSAVLSEIANEKSVSVVDLDEELDRVLSIECDKVCLIQRKN